MVQALISGSRLFLLGQRLPTAAGFIAASQIAERDDPPYWHERRWGLFWPRRLVQANRLPKLRQASS